MMVLLCLLLLGGAALAALMVSAPLHWREMLGRAYWQEMLAQRKEPSIYPVKIRDTTEASRAAQRLASDVPVTPIGDRSSSLSAPNRDPAAPRAGRQNLEPIEVAVQRYSPASPQAPAPAPALEETEANSSFLPVVPQPLVLTIGFGFDSVRLGRGARQSLELVLQRLRLFPSAVVEISGFADPEGSPLYNADLSQRRADAVAAFLVAQGIAPERMESIGRGTVVESEERSEVRRRVKVEVVNRSVVASQPM